MIFTTSTVGDIASGETDVVMTNLRSVVGKSEYGVIFAHGSGADALSSLYGMRFFFQSLARHATIHFGDYGGQTWGSDLVVERIGDAIDMLRTEHGVTGKVALFGASMGGCSVLNYAYRYPEDVASVSALIPLTDLNNARANPWLTDRWPEMDAIYGSPPDFTGHNPVQFAAAMDPDLPIRLWSSSNDGLAQPSTHHAFVAARPQTVLTNIGAFGHSVPNTAERIGEVVDHVMSGLVNAV